MSFRDVLIADLRLVILRLLAEDGLYEANSSTLLLGVAEFGHARVSRDQIHTEMSWLAEQGLLEVTAIKTVLVGKLTQRGLDVAKGKAHVPGVKQPGPGG